MCDAPDDEACIYSSMEIGKIVVTFTPCNSQDINVCAYYDVGKIHVHIVCST